MQTNQYLAQWCALAMLQIDSIRSVNLISFRNGKQSSPRSVQSPKNSSGVVFGKSFAEEIADKAFLHLAGNDDLLSRFLALTGLDPLHLRDIAGEAGFLSGVLDFYLGHEPTLMALCEAENINPKDVAKARAILDPNEPINA